MARANFLDRAIGFLAPGVAVNRARQRAVLDVFERRSGYEGASIGRKTASWRTVSASADAEISAAAPLLRDRMRDLERNNPHAANAISQLVAHVIGDGIVARPKTGNKRRDAKITKLWKRFVDNCDHDGKLDFYGLQTLAFREMVTAGDGIVRRRRKRSDDGLPVPLQLQVVETDLIDTAKTWANDGNAYVLQGVQFNAAGKRTGYWMFPAHPGNSHLDPKASLQSTIIPVADIAHAYELQRTAVRGVPWGSPVIATLRDLQQYEEAEIVRKKIEACMVGVLVGGDESDGVGIPLEGEDEPGIYDVDGARVEKFEPGMFAVAKGGKDVKFNSPASTGSYEAYKKASLHTIAAGFRMPYSLVSGDLTQVNYSSAKVGLEAFKRLVSTTQWQIVIPMICAPVWAWFCEAAYLAGEIDTIDIPVEWTPPRFMSADPKKDVEGSVAEVRAGFKSPQRAIAETGYDPEEVLDEIEAWNKLLDDRKIILDSDPRRITQAGQTQPPEPADKPPATEPKGDG